MIRRDLIENIRSENVYRELQEQFRHTLEAIQDQEDPDMRSWAQGSGHSSVDYAALARSLPELRRKSREFFWSNPHGKVALRTHVKFSIGGSCVVDFHEEDPDALKALIKWWKKCTKSIKWFGFIREYMTRAARDGEVIVRKIEVEDSSVPLKVRFIDSERVSEDGIQVDPLDVESAISYTIEGARDPIPADQIHHFKGFNADRNMRRGRPNLEPILPMLAKYGDWLQSRIVLSRIRNSVALVKQVNGTGQDLLRLRNNQAATHNRGINRNTNQVKMLQPGSILQATPGVEYKMIAPNLDAKDASEDGRNILLAAAAGSGLPDVFMTADYNHANFASSVVAQNPAIREFEEVQKLLAEELSEIVDWFLQDGISKGQIPATVTDENGTREVDLEFDISFPPILRADLAKENAAYALMNEMGVMSRRTWALKMGLDPDQEQKYIAEEPAVTAPEIQPTIQRGVPPALNPDLQPPTGVADRAPRANNQVGGESVEGEKVANLHVVVKKKRGKENAEHIGVEYRVLRPEPETEVGGDWPNEHVA